MPLKCLQLVSLYVWSDGTYGVSSDLLDQPDGEGHADYGRTDMLGIALTRVLRATIATAEIKVASRPT